LCFVSAALCYVSEAKFGIKISEQYRFIIITGPVPEVYAKRIKVKVETAFSRAGKGGTGTAKCRGNYCGALYPTQLAREEGYDQWLWKGVTKNKFIEESGMMNAMFVINDALITPSLSDSILAGITRESLLILANDLAYKTEERPIAVTELKKAFHNKTITEAFGAGEAAVVAPIQTININGTDHQLPQYSHKNLFSRIKQKLDRIRKGQEEDIYRWNSCLNFLCCVSYKGRRNYRSFFCILENKEPTNENGNSNRSFRKSGTSSNQKIFI